MTKPTETSKKPSPPTPDTPSTPDLTAAQGDIALFLEAGMKALREKIVREEAPEILSKAKIFGYTMPQVAVIVLEARKALTREGVRDDESAKELRKVMAELLKNPAPEPDPQED